MAIALHEMDMVVGETVLRQKAAQYSRIFDQMQDLYSSSGQPEKALAISEAFRAGTVRIHTMSATEKLKHEELAAKKAVAASFEQLMGGGNAPLKIKPLKLEPILPQLEPLREYVRERNIALLSLGVSRGFVTALILTRKTLFRNGLEMHRWKIDPALMENARRYLDLDPSPFREQRIQRLCEDCWLALLEPLQQILRKHAVSLIGLTAPSLIGQLPFEGFRRPSSTDVNLTPAMSFFYLPSLRVGSDLVAHNKGVRNGKLLVVGYADDDLPFTIQEVDALRELFKDRIEVLNTARASKREVIEKIQEPYDYIHFTCHGSFNGLVPLDSALHLVRNPENDSQRITARELLAVKLTPFPVVTMSACSTALVGIDASNGYAGLTGSLLRAGARCVIGSRWPVYDDAAAIFMTALYSRLVARTHSPFDCFALTQHDRTKLTALEDWAAFAYVGLP